MIMDKEKAEEFFGELYGGSHHFPSTIKEWGDGWCMNHNRGDLSTFDFNALTRLVLMAHRDMIRVELRPVNMQYLKIIIHQRNSREGSLFERHPTIYDAVAEFNLNKN